MPVTPFLHLFTSSDVPARLKEKHACYQGASAVFINRVGFHCLS